MELTKRLGKTLLGAGLAILFGFAITAGNQALAQTWTQLAPSGTPPAVRSHHSAVYDPATNQMIVFGGRGGDPSDIIFNDDWRLTDANGVGAPAWILVPKAPAPAGSIPAPRWVHRAVYDQANDRMIVFGGGLGRSSPCTNTVYVLTDASGAGGTPTWSFLTAGGPAPRFAHSAVYDPDSNKLIVFGGSNCISAPTFGDLWVLSNANGSGGPPTWALLGQSGSAPGLLSGHTAVYDSVNNRMIVFGGLAINNNVWVLENADGTGGPPTWSLLSPSETPPPARSNHQAVYDAAANEMIVFGGETPGFVNDVWVLSGANGLGGTPTWAELFPSGGPPLARTATTAVFDQATKRMTVFGGSGSNLNDTWVLQLGPTQVSIDIKPGSDPNSINLCSMGVIPVAIFGSATFDVNDIEFSSLVLGGAHVKMAGRSGKDLCRVTDVNDDGFDDLVCQFVTVGLTLDGGATTATVVGQLYDGTVFEGTDSVNIVKDTCG